MSRFDHHFFVCTNSRAVGGRPACGQAGHTLARQLQEAVSSHPGLRGRAAVTPCACLGTCFDGPTLVAYPSGTWYVGVTEHDIKELLDAHAMGEIPLSRLEYEWVGDDD